MDLKQLHYFVRVAELGSFVKAADVLGVAQPTLSRQIRLLEVALGTSLFHRNGRGVLLTPLGLRFAEQAQGVLHAADAALQVLRTGDRRLAGKVICGLTPSVGRLLIAPFARQFREQLPDATLSIVSQHSLLLHDQMKAARLDFAIFHNPTPNPQLSITPLSDEALYLIGATPVGRHKATVAFRELDQLPLVMPSRLHVVRSPVDLEAARQGVHLHIALEVDAMESLFELVAGGMGHTIATRFPVMGRPKVSKLVAQRIVEPGMSTPIALVTPLHRTLTPLQQAAAELAKSIYLGLA